MFNLAIAKMSETRTAKAVSRLEKLDRAAQTNYRDLIKIVPNGLYSCYIMLRHDCPEMSKQWLCGFFAAF